MGFFSLPLARLVSPNGRVICVDFQEKMIKSLRRRARRANLANRIDARVCHRDSLGLDDLVEAIDFALAFAVVHEVLDASRLFREICNVLKPSAKLLVAEPKGHISTKAFDVLVSAAERNALRVVDKPRIALSHTIVLEKKRKRSTNPIWSAGLRFVMIRLAPHRGG